MGMFGNINQKQIEKVMKQMGIAQQPLDAKRVIIELEDSNIIIDEPSVTKVKMQGQETFQITGESREESRQSYSEDDVKMVIEKTNKPADIVREALEKSNGDIAEAILELQ